MTEFGGDRDKPTSHRLVHSTFTAEIEKESKDSFSHVTVSHGDMKKVWYVLEYTLPFTPSH